MDQSSAAQELTGIGKTLSSLPVKTLVIALIMLVAAILATRIIVALADRVLRRTRLDSSLHSFLKTLLRFILYFTAIVSIASYLGIDLTSLVALLSVVTLAISLSVQNVLSNVAGGIMVIGTKPFKQGDYVSIEGLEGTIDEIGVVYTTLHTIDNRSVLIPNSKVSASTIENFSSLGKRRLELVVGASYTSDPERTMAALRRAVDRCDPLEGEPVVVEFQDFGDSAISYHVCLWIPASEYLDRRYAMRRYVWEEFKKAGVEMTYPHLNVHLDKDEG